MLIYLKLDKTHLAKIIQPDGFLGKTLGNVMDNLSKKILIDFAVPFAEDFLSKLTAEATSFISEKFEIKKWKRSYSSKKRIHFIHFK